jgi:hypothetical protein
MRTQSDPPLIGFLAIIETMIRHTLKSLNTSTPVQLTIDDNSQSPNTLVVQNVSESGFIYLGNENVSSTNYGFRLEPTQAFTAEMAPYNRIYAVCSAGTMTAAVMVIERYI